MLALLVNEEEADEFTNTAEIVLAENPLMGVPVTKDGTIWQLAMPPVRGRSVSLYYSFDEQNVTFLFIIPIDDKV